MPSNKVKNIFWPAISYVNALPNVEAHNKKWTVAVVHNHWNRNNLGNCFGKKCT